MSDEHVELGNAGTGLEQARHLLSCAEEEVITTDITIPLLRSITHAAIATAEAARETRDLLRAILAELQAQRPATITNEWDPAVVAAGEEE